MASKGLAQNVAAIAGLNQIGANTAVAQQSTLGYQQQQADLLNAIKNLSGLTTPQSLAEYRKNFGTVITGVTEAYQKRLAGFTPGLLASPSFTGMNTAISNQMADYGTRVLSDFGTVGAQVQKAGSKASQNLEAISQKYMQQTNQAGNAGVATTADLSNKYIQNLQGMGSAGVSSLGSTSERGATRLYGTLAAPISAFQSIKGNSAFSNLANPAFMQLAAKPPTVTSDVGSMASLYKYNV